jgi:tol-pal system protein YbgF
MTSKINALRAAAFVVACSALPMQAQAFEDSDARRAILQIRTQLKEINARIDSEISNINNRIGTEIEQLARRIDTKADDKKVNALFTDLEKLRNELRAEVAELRGQVEILNNELNKSVQKVDKLSNDLANDRRRATDLYANIEQRLSKLEPRRQTIDGADYEVTQTEQKMFDEAAALLKKKDFTAAAQAFTTFLQRFPGSGYSAQAYYLLGSSYFAAEDCKNAIPALQTVITRYAMTQRAPDAMLNLAICHEDLDDQNTARSTLEALIKKYPESTAAKTARAKLSALK